MDYFVRTCNRCRTVLKLKMRRKTLEERLITHTKILETGCVIWIGSTSFGYGKISYKGKSYWIHRFVYERKYGKLEHGVELHHRETCPKTCFNTDHLTKTTRKGHPDSGCSVNRNKTHCPLGHEYTGTNLIVRTDGSRRCRTCVRKQKRILWRMYANLQHTS